jgi:hypothetical protein
VYKAIDLLFVACKGVCLVLKGTYPEIPFWKKCVWSCSSKRFFLKSKSLLKGRNLTKT